MRTVHVSLEAVNRQKGAIDAYANQEKASLATFRQQAANILNEFENRLYELEHIRDLKAAALSRCEMRRSLNEDVSCAAEERAYEIACEKCLRCESLISQAHAAIAEFDEHAERFHQALADLSSRSEKGLARIEAIIQDYMTSE